MEMKRNRAYRFMAVSEVAERLHRMNMEEGLDFTFDSEDFVQEPTGWFGFKKVSLFDEPCGNIAMGDYGASATNIYSLQDESLEEMETAIQWLLSRETECKIETICVEIPAKVAVLEKMLNI